MLIRPATGEIDEESAKVMAAAGYPLIALFDVTAWDWDVIIKLKISCGKLRRRQSEEVFVLLHILDDTHTIEALPIVIEEIAK